ncbi:MAG: glycosyltransferase [bacterium]
MVESKVPGVSVVIPVYNDVERLERCLDSLAQQTYPVSDYEVIVVDNASTDDIKTVVDRCPVASYQFESKPGSYAARNRGLLVARGEIIAFTDSDCLPAADWIEKGVKELAANPDAGLIGGAIELFYIDPKRLTAVEVYESILGFPQEKYIREQNFGATANVFTYRRVIDDVGAFNDALKSGGDSEWGKRVAAAGYPLVYSEFVKVGHPSRSTFAEYYQKTIRVMSGLPAFRRSGMAVSTILWQMLKGLVIPPFERISRILKQADHRSTKEKIKLVIVVLFIRYIWVLEGARLQYRNR